jgi:hypothetical protein
MKKLLEFLALNPAGGDVGVEIEVEGKNLPAVFDGGWRTEVDNSLRGGQEYIFDGPCNLDGVKKRLLRLHEAFKNAEAQPKFSFRTSVHVHLNVQQLTYNQLLNAIYTYLLIEEPLMNLCGEERKGNRFCLRLADAEGMLDTLAKLFAGGEGSIKRNIPHNKMRYSAINVEALGKYGSLEFRAMKGNMDTDKIVLWCNSLINLRDFAQKFDNPKDIYNLYIKEEAAQFFNTVLGDCAKNFEYPELVHDIQRNFSLSIDLPFAFAKRKEQLAYEPMFAEVAMPKMKIPDVFQPAGYKEIRLTGMQETDCAKKAHSDVAKEIEFRDRMGMVKFKGADQHKYLLSRYTHHCNELKKKIFKEIKVPIVARAVPMADWADIRPPDFIGDDLIDPV